MMYQDLIKDNSSSPEDVFFELANATTVSYRTKGDIEVKVEQNSTIDNSTGGIVWETAYLLATYLENNIVLDSHPRILEVGSGCGLLGIALAFQGAHVICTETENTMTTLEKNIKANKKIISKDVKGFGGTLKARTLRWDYPEDRNDKSLSNLPFDLIVGTDIFFDIKLVAPLLETMRTLSTQKTEVYLCFQERCADAHAEFLKIASKYFNVIENRSELLYATHGCEAAAPLECFLFYLSGAIVPKSNPPLIQSKLESESIKKKGKEKKEKKSSKKTSKKDQKTVVDSSENISSANTTQSSSSSSNTTNSSSWFKLAFERASSRAEPDVSFPLKDDKEEGEATMDEDFNGSIVASIAQAWSNEKGGIEEKHKPKLKSKDRKEESQMKHKRRKHE